MRQFQIDYYKKLFSFIPNDFKGNIDIQKIDEGFLRNHYQDYYWDGSLGSSKEEYSVDFVLDNGEIIKNAVKVGEHSGSNYAYSQEVYIKGETIAEAIDRLGIASQIRYIVVYFSGYNDWSGQELRKWNDLTIYKNSNCYIEKYIENLKREIEKDINNKIKNI